MPVRQGDVLLIKLDSVDLTGAKQEVPEGNYYILAKGEATGHAHKILKRLTTLYLLGEFKRILDVKVRAQVQHEEHGNLELDPGLYQVVQQREYRPEGIRNVRD